MPFRRLISASAVQLWVVALLVAWSWPAAQNGAQNSASEKVYDLHEPGLKPPRTISAPDPAYSEEARKAKISGSVILAITVTSAGDVRDVQVTRMLGSGLDEKATEAVRRWKFEPATLEGKPVAVRINVAVQFKIY